MQKNPLTIRGTLTRCWLFTYQTPVKAAASLVPPPLELVTHRECAFWNIVVSRIEQLRPRPFPSMTGIRYWHVAYRLYVRYRAAATPEPIEGLYFVRSDCNNPLIAAAGNRLTDFRFHRASIQVNEGRSTVTIQIESPDAAAYASLRPEVPPQRAPHSAFSSLDQAAAFLKYKPAGISLTEDGAANVVHITRSEATWQSKLVQVETATWEFLKDKPAKPEICFQVEPISYQWNRGEIYRPAAEAG